MQKDQNLNPYRPPLSEVTDTKQSSLGSIGLLTGLAFTLSLTLTPAIVLTLQQPYKIDKIVITLLASLVPQSVIVANAWWWSVRGKSASVARFFMVSAIQSLLLAISFVGTSMLFFKIVIGTNVTYSDIDITSASVIFSASFFITSLLGLIVEFRIRRALRYKQDI